MNKHQAGLSYSRVSCSNPYPRIFPSSSPVSEKAGTSGGRFGWKASAAGQHQQLKSFFVELSNTEQPLHFPFQLSRTHYLDTKALLRLEQFKSPFVDFSRPATPTEALSSTVSPSPSLPFNQFSHGEKQNTLPSLEEAKP